MKAQGTTNRALNDRCAWSQPDPNVWTGGVLQEENLETAALGLAPMYPAYLWSCKMLLAIMDMSAHPI